MGVLRMSKKLRRAGNRYGRRQAAFNKITSLNEKIADKINSSDHEMIQIVHKGEYTDTQRWLNSLLNQDYLNVLDSYGKRGVELLRDATPRDTGLTASSWTYDIIRDNKGNIKVSWYNTNEVENKSGYKFNVAMLIQTGHATRNGGWVEGIDYINPALKPLFDEMAEAVSDEIRRR